MRQVSAASRPADFDQIPGLGAHQGKALERRSDPRKRTHQLVLALAVEPGDAHYLAAPEVEVDAVRLGPDAQPVGPHDDFFACRVLRRVRLGMREVPVTGHETEQVLLGDLCLLQHPDVATVPHDGGAIADADELGDAVGDDDHRRALVAQLAHLGEESLGGVQIESGRRLVEDEHLRVHQQRPADGDPLLDGER